MIGAIHGVAGASVISATAVLTAAHNFSPSSSHELIFGAINRVVNEPNQQRRTVQDSAWILHPEYNLMNLANDIAIIRFPQNPLTLNTFVQAIDLAFDNSELFAGEEAYVSGFGIFQAGQASDVVRFTIKNVMSNQACSTFAPGFIRDTTICAIGDPSVNNSVCTGDSGGPLAVRRQGRSVQVGVVSFGLGACGNAGVPDGYARVSSFHPWIVASAQL